MPSESQKRASKKYDKVHTVSITLKLNRESDADVLGWLAGQKNRQGSIKTLIRNQIARESEMKP